MIVFFVAGCACLAYSEYASVGCPFTVYPVTAKISTRGKTGGLSVARGKLSRGGSGVRGKLRRENPVYTSTRLVRRGIAAGKTHRGLRIRSQRQCCGLSEDRHRLFSPPGIAMRPAGSCFTVVSFLMLPSSFDNGWTDGNADCCVNTVDKNLPRLQIWRTLVQ